MELWNRARGFAEEAAKRSQYLPQPSIINGVYLHRFGITQELREFVEGITITTFEDFPLQDDTELSDVPAVSNVRQDLTEWQEKHARLVLSTVKEISRLRYEPCPQVMKERKFWRIYFILVNNHIAPLSGFSDDGDGGYDDDLDKLMDNSDDEKGKS
ncbi:hypothetical protein D0Y65_045230 [Glycine soja]|nr:hypothetical protein D0Y65_045230 [Glycine soja]